MKDIKEQLIENMLQVEFRRGVRVGVDKACQMLRLLPKDQWERAIAFLEKPELDAGTWAKVDEIIESDQVMDAEIIE